MYEYVHRTWMVKDIIASLLKRQLCIEIRGGIAYLTDENVYFKMGHIIIYDVYM